MQALQTPGMVVEAASYGKGRTGPAERREVGARQLSCPRIGSEGQIPVIFFGETD